MRITVIGTGYVGLVSGACFADFGHTVTCVDKDEHKIGMLQQMKIPIFEDGLEDLVKRNYARQSLSFTSELADAVASAKIVFLAVGTPSRRGDGHADLRFVYDAAREIARHIEGYTVICTKSTVPVGTGDEIERIIREVRPHASFSVVSNPEFLREGSAIGDFKRPERIVIGTDDERAAHIMEQAYRPLSLNKTPIIQMSRRGAELTKYAANAFLATKITFINEIADLCEAVGADVQDVARGIGLDNRIGTKFLHAGPGYGGSCFPKDTLAFLRTSQDLGSPQRIVEAVVTVNQARKRSMGSRIVGALGRDPRGSIVTLLGLAFKPNTDDMRDSPAIDIVQALQDRGVQVRVCDPEALKQARQHLDNVTYFEDHYEAMRGSDAAVLVTEWDAYRALDLERVRELLARPCFIDLRNVYSELEMETAGLRYSGVGRAPCQPGKPLPIAETDGEVDAEVTATTA